jgi:hypothetical protein
VTLGDDGTLPPGFIIEHETRGVLVGQEYDERQIENARTYLGWSTLVMVSASSRWSALRVDRARAARHESHR